MLLHFFLVPMLCVKSNHDSAIPVTTAVDKMAVTFRGTYRFFALDVGLHVGAN